MTYSNKNYAIISPSQVVNIPWIILGILTIQLWVFALLAIARIIQLYCWKYEFNERTLVERKGVFSVERKELHYYRIKSVYITQPFLLRIFGLSNIYIKSSDPYLPVLQLYAIEKGRIIKEELESLTHQERKIENVREFDMYEL